MATTVAANNVQVPIGFNFTFFGGTYSSVVIGPRGYMVFRSVVSISQPTLWPDAANTNGVPIFAYFFTSFTIPTATAFQYGTIGLAPSRAFLVRLTGVKYSDLTTSSNTLDALLYETTNVLEVRYYSISNTAAQFVTIGVLAGMWRYTGNVADYTTLLNLSPINATTLPLVQNNMATFTPTTLLPAFVGPASYTVTQTKGVDPSSYRVTPPVNAIAIPYTGPLSPTAVPIGFTFTFCGGQYAYFGTTLAGHVHFSATTIFANSGWGASTTNNIAPLLVIYAGGITVSISTLRDRTYELVGTYPNRRLIVRWQQISLGALTPPPTYPPSFTVYMTLFEFDSSITVEYINVESSAAWTTSVGLAGVQCRTIPYPNWTYDVGQIPVAPNVTTARDALHNTTVRYVPTVPIPPPAMLDMSTVAYWRSTATAEGTYYAANKTLSSSVAVFTAPLYYTLPADGTPVLIPIGFNMAVFNDRFSHLFLSAHGYLRFKHRTMMAWSTATDGSFLSLPQANDWEAPVVAFAAGRWTTTNSTVLATQLTGAVGGRTFVLRILNLAYVVDTSLSMDLQVQFTESSGAIEVDYMRVDPADTPITIGAQGPSVWAPYSPFPSVTFPPALNYALFVNGGVLFRYRSMLVNTGLVFTVFNQPLGRSSFTSSTRSYAVASPALNYTTAGIPVLPAASAFTIVPTNAANTAIRHWVLPLDFTFFFYGVPFTTALLQLDGLLYFGNFSDGLNSTTDANGSSVTLGAAYSPSTFTPLTVPSTSFTFPIADMENRQIPSFLSFLGTNMTLTASSIIGYTTDGMAPARRFILRFEAVKYVGSAATVTVHVMLFENSGSVVVAFTSLGSTTQSFSVGVQNRSSTVRFDNSVDWVSTIGTGATVALSTLTSKFVTFSWQSYIAWPSTNDALNIGLNQTLSNFTLPSLPVSSTARSFTFQLQQASREALLIRYGGSFGNELVAALAQVMEVPQAAVAVVNVEFFDVNRTVVFGADLNLNITRILVPQTTATVSVRVSTPTSDLTVVPSAAVAKFFAAVQSATSTLYTVPSVLNDFGNAALQPTRQLVSPSTAAVVAPLMMCSDGVTLVASSSDCPAPPQASSTNYVPVIVGAVVGGCVVIAALLAVVYVQIAHGRRGYANPSAAGAAAADAMAQGGGRTAYEK